MKDWLVQRLRCPDCHHSRLANHGEALVCAGCGMQFAIVDGKPVLLRHDNGVFQAKAYCAENIHVACARKQKWGMLFPSISVNLCRDRVLDRMGSLFNGLSEVHVLVVGGGKQRIELDQKFRSFPHIHLFYSDISTRADVDCYCDCHELPFADDSFDGVITTAVLEHVLYPERAATEICRVLKTDGVIYSELPFMQQVHEGAYDFTRFTLSGHRRLFNRFQLLESGLVAGPATALAWAIESFAMAFFSRRRPRLAAKALARCGFFWLKYLDYYLADLPQATDGASCTYFFGRKGVHTVADSEIVNSYAGVQSLHHT